MLEIIFAAVGAVVCIGYILSSAASDQEVTANNTVNSTYQDADNKAA